MEEEEGGKDSQEVGPLMRVTLNSVLPLGAVAWRRLTAGLSGQVPGPGTEPDATVWTSAGSCPCLFSRRHNLTLLPKLLQLSS